jgi:ribonuclease P protein component
VVSGHGIQKSMRLRRRAEFVAVQGSGIKIHGRAFLALVTPSTAAGSVGRVGVTVTRRVGNAVTRNRIKRLVREWLRQNGWVPAGCDVVIVAKESASELRGLADVAPDLAKIRARLDARCGSAGGGGSAGGEGGGAPRGIEAAPC